MHDGVSDDDMIVIKKLKDIKQLRDTSTLPQVIVDYLHNFFLNIYTTFSEGDEIHDFTLDSSGYIVVLQTADDVARLPEVGLTRGLTASVPEYVDRITLSESGQFIEIYQALFLRNNEWGLNVLSIIGSLNEASEAFLRDNCD
ncbi:MAG: hypothetical protein AB9835_02095 [Eubacteriales bacterium]